MSRFIDGVSNHVSCLNLSNRTYGLLRKSGLMRVEQLQAASDQELLVIPGLGATALAEIRAKVQEFEKKQEAQL